MRESKKGVEDDSREPGGQDINLEYSSGEFDDEDSRNTRSVTLAVVSVMLLAFALIIATVMILRLRQDRDDSQKSDKEQSDRIAQLEGKTRVLEKETTPTPPITVFIPGGSNTIIDRQTSPATSESRTNTTTSPNVTTAPPNTTPTTSTSTTQPETCVGILCVRGIS